MTFTQKISAYNLDLLLDKDLPDIALTGLIEDYDSASLRILAGYNELSNPFLLVETFEKSLNEMGMVLPDRKQSLINVISFHATSIVEGEIDPYIGFEAIDRVIRNTEFNYPDLDLDACYGEYITIWELMTDGLQMHTGSGLTKEQFIQKTKINLSDSLAAWLKQRLHIT